MEKIEINRKNFLDSDIKLIVKALKQGKVLALPTDTIYGLSCDAANKEAVEKLYRIKRMPLDRPSLILAKSYCMLNKYSYISLKQREYLNKIWPGPVTVILKGKKLLPEILSGEESSLAARLPNDNFLITIIEELGYPIISTSLNIHGQKYIEDLSEIGVFFKKAKPDLAVDCGRLRNRRASKLIDLRNINNIKILRK